MKSVSLVPSRFVHQVWPHVAGYLAAAVSHASAGDATLDQLRADVAANRQALYVVKDDTTYIGGIVVVFQTRHNQRVAFISALGGRGIVTRALWGDFVSLLRAEGVTHVEGIGRKSIARLYQSVFGMQQKAIVFGVDV